MVHFHIGRKGGKVEIIIQGRLGIVEYDDYGMEAFEDNYNVTFGWIDINSVMVGTDTVEDIESHQVKKAHFYELFRANGPHPLPVSIRGRDEDNVEASYIIELSDDEVFDINKVQLICPIDRPDELWELYNFVADHILYDEKEISTNLLDYSADNPGLEDEISYL